MAERLQSNKQINEYLIKHDKVFSKVINACEFVDIEVSGDYFISVAESIVGQQLSGKVAEVICKRLHTLCEFDITPERILEFSDEQLRAIGLSYSKIGYLKNLAQAVKSKAVDFVNIEKLTNDEIVEMLSSVKGIGKWTAEMFLIFALGRADVFSLGDGGLQRAVYNFYNNGNPLKPAQIKEISDKWSPYRSVASLYLWKSLSIK